MMKSWMALLGGMALLVIGVAGIGSILVVKDRIRVEIALDAPQQDPLAEVKDDLKTLQGDVAALAQALEQQFTQIAVNAATESEVASARSKELSTSLASLGARIEEQARRLAQLEATVRALTPSGLAAHPAGVVVTPEPVATDAPAQTAAQQQAAPVPPAEPSKAESETAGGKKGFLGFRLPSRSFRFDADQRYEVLADLSRVGFDAKSTLHDFTGATTKVSGAFEGNLADPAKSFTGVVACDATALDTGVEGRDEAMREHLATEKDPQIVFTVQSLTPDAGGVDVGNMTCNGTVRGLMKIRGVEKALEMPVRIAIDASRRLSIEGQAKVHLPDYEVPVPNKVVISMEPDVTIWIALRARAAATGGGNAK